MKHLLLLALLVLLAPAARSQSANPAIWCPPGASWTYGYFEMSGSGTLTVRYVRDTLVAGQAAQLLTRRINMCYSLGPGACLPAPPRTISSVITRVVANRVEVWANGQFYTLYDFAAQPGASWLTPSVYPAAACVQNMMTVTVDSVGQRLVGGCSLRWFRAHLSNAAGPQGALGWGQRVYELVGSTTYLQPQAYPCGGTDPGYMSPLTAFAATGPPAISYAFPNGRVALSAQTRTGAAGFVAYPNPTAGLGFVTVRLPLAPLAGSHLLLLDLTGRQVREQKAVDGQPLDVRGLAAGSYTLLLHEPGRPVLAQRLVLE